MRLVRGFSIFLSIFDLVYGGIYNRYVSGGYGKGAQVYKSTKISTMKIELLNSFGMSRAMLSTAKQAIINHFTHELMMSGVEADQIGEEMERAYGGLWAVYNFDIDYDIAYTIVRRSPSYCLFQVDDRGIFMARDGFPDPPEGGFNRPMLR